MSTKLTITIDKTVIKKAKKYAKVQGRSLSNLIEEYLKSISSADQKLDDSQLSPITKSLYGAVKMKDSNLNYKKILAGGIFKKDIKSYNSPT